MTAPNRNILWARTLLEELAYGIDAVCLSPGSRSTPLALAAAEHPDIETYSHLDERSAAFFALGRGRATGRPTAVICTSGTAAANFHPAVLEAHEGRVPLLVLTADRPPELVDSGANQTTDQDGLYGNAVRFDRTLPEPEADARKLRSLRVLACRAVAEATGVPAGPVHLNVPFAKPLEPTTVPDDVPDEFDDVAPLAADGRSGPFVDVDTGRPTLDAVDLDALAKVIDDARRGLIVAGPATEPVQKREAIVEFARTVGYPILADPLSGLRFGPHVEPGEGSRIICGGYDSYVGDIGLPEPDLVLRFGASPTSKRLRKYLKAIDARQVVVDPAGGWPEAAFTASQLVVAAPTPLVEELTARVEPASELPYLDTFDRIETDYWDHIRSANDCAFEGSILHAVCRASPTPASLFVSNSMPVRDLDRFGEPRAGRLDASGNRGVSGIDGVTSTALGVGSATDRPLVLVTGDLAYYHDMNGLLALRRCDVPATIVLVDNDGGGIFHKLPIEAYDPPFTELFKTPHGIDFAPTGDLYDFDFEVFEDLGSFEDAFTTAVGNDRPEVLCVRTDAEASHRRREKLQEEINKELDGEN